MNASEYLWIVYKALPAAVLIDVVIFMFFLVVIRRWKEWRR